MWVGRYQRNPFSWEIGTFVKGNNVGGSEIPVSMKLRTEWSQGHGSIRRYGDDENLWSHMTSRRDHGKVFHSEHSPNPPWHPYPVEDLLDLREYPPILFISVLLISSFGRISISSVCWRKWKYWCRTWNRWQWRRNGHCHQKSGACGRNVLGIERRHSHEFRGLDLRAGWPDFPFVLAD